MTDKRRAVCQWLDSLQRAGVTHVPKSAPAVGKTTPLALGACSVRAGSFSGGPNDAESSVAEPNAPGDSSGVAPPQPWVSSVLVEKAKGLGDSLSELPPSGPSCDRIQIDAPIGTVDGQRSLFADRATTADKAQDPAVVMQMPPMSREERVAALRQLAAEVARCQRCPELVRNRTQTVFGVGNPQAELVFVGEAPGADEDLQGEPFVGAAGQLLNKIIGACGLKREEVYIMNILRCRPPNNRTPLPDEADRCRPFLLGQLKIIRPKFICCLGACAAQNLLQTDRPIGKLRKQFFSLMGARVICTYHPAYLLRNPSAKRDTWEDMQMLLRAMGRDIPKTKPQ